MKLVDSSAWVEFLRRKGDPLAKQKVARLLEADLAAYTCPVRFELLSGVKPGEEADLTQALQFGQHVPFETDDWRAALAHRLAPTFLPVDDPSQFGTVYQGRERSMSPGQSGCPKSPS